MEDTTLDRKERFAAGRIAQSGQKFRRVENKTDTYGRRVNGHKPKPKSEHKNRAALSYHIRIPPKNLSFKHRSMVDKVNRNDDDLLVYNYIFSSMIQAHPLLYKLP